MKYLIMLFRTHESVYLGWLFKGGIQKWWRNFLGSFQVACWGVVTLILAANELFTYQGGPAEQSTGGRP